MALPAGGRFTAYLPDERELLQALAAEERSSENYLLRVAARALLGLPIPPRYRAMIQANLDTAPSPSSTRVAA